MLEPRRVTIVNVGCRSTNYWVVSVVPALTPQEYAAVVSASWRALRERGATRVYPGHGPVRPIDAESVV